MDVKFMTLFCSILFTLPLGEGKGAYDTHLTRKIVSLVPSIE